MGGITSAIKGEDVLTGALAGAASGAITGAATDIIMVTGGTGLVVVGAMALAGGLGGLAGTAIESARESDIKEKATFKDYAFSFLDGAVIGGLFGYLGGSVGSKLGAIGKKGFSVVAKQMIKKEVQQLGSSVLNEILSNTVEGLIKLTIKAYKKAIVIAFTQ